ncbi:hypothetical protein EW026_g4960 [Hermanssonia centrifuga]|uniref:Uncharacterized protein n=1 Tax=Hermanssonia centrifuga TaxID=98765 RepID=A0A4S4KFL2_9APHY|nr:hypothetical protein EW026_g4960 [Hermanssonia centrifuga]
MLETDAIPAWYIGADTPDQGDGPGTEIPELFDEGQRDAYTRHTDPWKPTRVAAILKAVTIGPDLSPSEREQVQQLVREYADCFALSISERIYLNKKIDEMLEAGIIEQCKPDEVLCVSPTTLAQKAHEGGGLSLDELRAKVNEQCIAAGLQLPYPERAK